MKRKVVDQLISKKVQEIKLADESMDECMRELMVAGIRHYDGEQDFLKPYPEPKTENL